MDIRKVLIPIAFIWILLTNCIFVQAQQGIRFVHDAESWEAVLQLATARQQPVFVDVYTEWCGPCKWMDQYVFNQDEVGEYMNARFVNVKLDAEKGWGPEFTTRFGVASYPTYLYFDPSGDLLFSSGGSRPAADFLANGKHALGNWRSGISSRGLEDLLKGDLSDMKALRAYMDRLAGSDLRTGFLLDRYLELLPKDSLMSPVTIALIKNNLASPVNLHSKGFQILVDDYKKKPVRNMVLGSSWHHITGRLEHTLDSAASQGNEALLNDILDLQTTLYPPRTAVIYQAYYRAYYYAGSQDGLSFVTAFEDFLNTVYKPDEVADLITLDEQEYQEAIRMERDAMAPQALSQRQLDGLKSHIGIVRTSLDQLKFVVSIFARVFPDIFGGYPKERIDLVMEFSNQLYDSNKVFVNKALSQSNWKFLATYKDLYKDRRSKL